jgi:ATP-dependent helicase/nuclease subunit A
MTVVLTDEQTHAVVRRSEPLLLSAAAGSGKTSVLVERFVAAVREDGIAPGKILAITFTERAAGELRSRVRARLLELGDREAARDTEAAFVGTFHGFCARVLRAHPLAAGLDPEFSIIDEGLAGRLRELAFKAALREFLAGERPDAVDLLAAYGVDRVCSMVERVYTELRSRGQRLPSLPLPSLPSLLLSSVPERVVPEPSLPTPTAPEPDAIAACGLLDELLRGYGLAYEQLKQGRRAVDFDDLELLTRELLAGHERVRDAWSDRFELLMVDEFQDTNARQLGILESLDRGNLFTVGDEQQSIYGFRHADVSLFRARRAKLEERGGSLLLTRNFRSREPLLDVVNAVFTERFAAYTPLVAGRVDAEIRGDRGVEVTGGGGADTPEDGETAVELLLTSVRGWEEREELAQAIAAGLPDAQLWRQAEARLLAQRVAELVEGGQARAGEVVVLLRASGDLEVFERALQLCGLRTLAAVGAFWGHQQIGDLISYLRALANPLDEEALYAALASPLAGCSRDCLALLAQAARSARAGVWETALAAAESEAGAELSLGLAPEDRVALVGFCVRLQAERQGASRRTLSELIERAIDAAGYREHVLALDWGERRLANVHKLLRLARRFEASEGRDLRAFLDHVAYLQDAIKAEPEAPVEGVEPDAVRLMTIHAAKGLEFPVVCLADLGRQPNTQTPDLLVDGERVGLRLVRLDGERSKPALDYEQLCRERREREAQEEDRILYVAMTRARERLLLSGAVDFERWPGSRQAPTAISWLGPALAADLPARVQAGEAAMHDLPVGPGGVVTVRCKLSSPASVGTVLRPESFAKADSAGSGTPSSSVEAVAGGQVGAGRVDTGQVGAGQVAGEQLSLLAEGAPSSIPTHPDVETMATSVLKGQQSPRGVADDASSPAPAPAGPPAPALASVPAPAPPPGPVLAPASVPAPAPPPGPVLAPASAPAPGLATLSYTSLSELERCGYRYYLERVLGLGDDRSVARVDPGHRGLEARARGTLIHRLMERVDFARPSPQSPQQVAKLARELGVRVGSGEREEIVALMAAAIRAAPATRVACARGVRREHPFAFALAPGQPLISGVIDLLAQESDDGFMVLDYKSDRVGPTVDLEALVQREYGIQRLLYALAVLRDGAPKVEIVHWFLERPGEPAVASFDAGERGALEERLVAHVAGARARGFMVSSKPHRGLCLTCPGRSGLCSWGERETLREAPELDRAPDPCSASELPNARESGRPA